MPVKLSPKADALDAASLSDEESIPPKLLAVSLAAADVDSKSFVTFSDADEASINPAVLASIVSSIARSSSAPIFVDSSSSFEEISSISPVTVIPRVFSEMRIPPLK